MEETIFDYLSEEDRFEGNELFEELVVNWDLRSMTLEEAFKIGFARGRNVVVTMEEPNMELGTALTWRTK